MGVLADGEWLENGKERVERDTSSVRRLSEGRCKKVYVCVCVCVCVNGGE